MICRIKEEYCEWLTYSQGTFVAKIKGVHP